MSSTKHAIGHLRRAGRGSIINLSSIYRLIGAPDVPPYHAGPEHPRWTEVVLDHSQALIRPLRKDDGEAEQRFIESLSPQTRCYRFLGEIVHPSRQLVEHLSELDYRRNLPSSP